MAMTLTLLQKVALMVAFILVIDTLRCKCANQQHSGGSAGTYTVYGKMDCIWTKRQLTYFKHVGLKHRFVNCASEVCTGMDAFPVTKAPDGTQTVGYMQVDGKKWNDPSFM